MLMMPPSCNNVDPREGKKNGVTKGNGFHYSRKPDSPNRSTRLILNKFKISEVPGYR